MREKYSIKKLFGKGLLLVFLASMTTGTASMLWETYVEDVIWENDEARIISHCETYLKEKQYGELWEYLELYDLRDEKYDVYWKAIDHRLEEIQDEQKQRAEMLPQ